MNAVVASLVFALSMFLVPLTVLAPALRAVAANMNVRVTLTARRFEPILRSTYYEAPVTS